MRQRAAVLLIILVALIALCHAIADVLVVRRILWWMRVLRRLAALGAIMLESVGAAGCALAY
jgi:hypothetical protein